MSGNEEASASRYPLGSVSDCEDDETEACDEDETTEDGAGDGGCSGTVVRGPDTVDEVVEDFMRDLT